MSVLRFPLGIFLLLGIAAHTSVLWSHFSSMWESNSFRFFPVAIAAAGYVAYRRRSKRTAVSVPPISELQNEATDNPVDATSGDKMLVMIGMFLSVLSAVITTVLATPTLGWISFLFFLAVIFYAGYGSQGLKAIWPSIVILAMVRLIPQETDSLIAIELQKVVSLLASSLLDAVGIVHFRDGALLSLADPRYQAEEACNGIRSLFSSLTFVFAWGILRGYGRLRHVFNLLQTLFWVLVLNALKLVTILVVQTKTSRSIAEGTPLEIASLVTFLLIIGIVLSTDQLIEVFSSKEDSIEPDGVDKLKSAPSTAGVAIYQTQFWTWPLSKSLAMAWMIGLCLAAVISLRMVSISSPQFTNSTRLPTPTKEALAEQIAGWTVTDFSHITRFDDHLLGRDSYQWVVRKGMREAQISLDDSAAEKELPQNHFAARGWRCVKKDPDNSPEIGAIEVTTVATKNDSEPVSPLPTESDAKAKFLGKCQEISLRKANGESGVLLFSKLDKSGNEVPEIPTGDWSSPEFWNSRFAIGLSSLLGNTKQPTQVQADAQALATRTLRLTCIPNVDLNVEDVADLKKLFFASEDLLRKSPVFDAAQ